MGIKRSDIIYVLDRTDRFDEYMSMHCDPSRSSQALVASLKSIFGPRTYRILKRVFQKIQSTGVDDHIGRARSTSMTSVRQKRSLDSTLMSLSPGPDLDGDNNECLSKQMPKPKVGRLKRYELNELL